MRKIYFLVALVYFNFQYYIVNAQATFYNNGSLIVSSSAIFHINGNLINDGATADFTNTGTITIANSTNPGTITLQNNSVFNDNGTLRVEQDFVNNATFNAGPSSNVELFSSSATQLITGTVNTTFNNLILTGTGTGAARIKRMTLDATVSGQLILNDRELATDANTMFVTNPAVTAITNNTTPGNEGFVSSLGNGSLSRVVNANQSYVFPTGSSLGVMRYRPVELMPDANSVFTVRFVNNDPNLDGLNRTQLDTLTCNVNPNWYHKINRTGAASFADINIAYVPAVDGNWANMATYKPTNLWTDMGTTTASTIGAQPSVKRASWQNFLTFPNDAYILSEQKPAAPVISGDTTVCGGANAVVYTASGSPNSTYTWTVSGGTIVGDSTSQSITVNWNSGITTGTISVIENSSTGSCSSASSGLFTITFIPSPIAGFDTITNGPLNQIVAFIDTSFGATSWQWNFGNGNTSTLQNPTQNYPLAGEYEIVQVVQNSFGCSDTAKITLKIEEGIIIPNVFSPNNDGINDWFYIPNTGMKEFSIEIFNRWGTKLWETTAPEIRWDGRTTAGVEVPDGTYFFILKAKSLSGKDYSTSGHVSLIR
jgi:gliding motility-associated-like protein